MGSMWQQKDAESLVRMKPFQRPSAGLPAQPKRQEYFKARAWRHASPILPISFVEGII